MSDFLTMKNVITTSQETVRDAHPLLSALLDCLKMQTLLSSKWPDLCHTLIFMIYNDFYMYLQTYAYVYHIFYICIPCTLLSYFCTS